MLLTHFTLCVNSISTCFICCCYSVIFVYSIRYEVCVLHHFKWHQLSLWSFFYVFTIMPRCKSWKLSRWQLLMYLQEWWWILSLKINQLPKVASASSSPLPLLPCLPSLISTIHCCHAWIPDRHLSSPFFPQPPPTSPEAPYSSIHTAFPSCSLVQPALIYSSLLPLSSISPPFPSYHRLLFLSTTTSAIPPSIRLSNGHQGRESPCSCLGQTLITHTVTLGWGHSHPFCTRSCPAHSTLYFLGKCNYRRPNGTKEAYQTFFEVKVWIYYTLSTQLSQTGCIFPLSNPLSNLSSRSQTVINSKLYLLCIDQFSSRPWLLQKWDRLTLIYIVCYWPVLSCCTFYSIYGPGASVSQWVNITEINKALSPRFWSPGVHSNQPQTNFPEQWLFA